MGRAGDTILGMAVSPTLLEILVCPACHEGLTYDEEASTMSCATCGLVYPVRDDIPVLLVGEATKA